MIDIDQEKAWQKLGEEAREWAVAEILAKYHGEFKELQSRHFRRLTQHVPDSPSAVGKESKSDLGERVTPAVLPPPVL